MPTSLLFVHPDSEARVMYTTYLLDRGYTVRHAVNTDSAFAIGADVDAVITELVVPGSLDATELIRRIRLDNTAIAIIGLTTSANSDKVRNAYVAGADTVLIKPCPAETVAREVRRLIDARDVRLIEKGDRRDREDRRHLWRGGRRWVDRDILDVVEIDDSGLNPEPE